VAKSMEDLAAALRQPAKKKPAAKKRVVKGRKKAAKRAKVAHKSTIAPSEFGLGEGSGVTAYYFPKSGQLYRKSVYFRADEWDAIKREAKASGESVTSIVRDAVRSHLKLGKRE